MGTVTEKHKQWPLYSQLPKCGEITASADGALFGLTCSRCRAIFRLEDAKEFRRHQKEQHANELRAAERQQHDEVSEGEEEVQQPAKVINSKKRRKTGISNSPPASSPAKQKIPFVSSKGRTTRSSTAAVKQEVDLEEAQPHIKLEVCMEVEPGEDNSKFGSDDSDAEDHEVAFDLRSDTEENHDKLDAKLDLLSLDNFEVLSYIIEVHEQNPVLWKVEHALNDSKIEIFKEMKKEIYTRFKRTLEYTDIREAFRGLRKMYHKALHNRSAIGTQSSQLWCFEQLEFLRGQKLEVNPKQQFTGDQFLQLAEIYKEHSLLWDQEAEGCHTRTLLVKMRCELLMEANEKMELNMTPLQLRHRIQRLRAYYYADKSKRISCKQYNEHFKPKQPLLFETLQFLEPFIGPFHCERCDEEIPMYPTYKAHMAEHDGSLPFKCSDCHKEFKSCGTLDRHRRRHTKERPYSCTICEARFKSTSALKYHQTTHSDERNHICDVCGAKYRTPQALAQHKLCSHNPNRERFKCKDCSKSFAMKKTLREHMMTHLNLRSAVCPVCNKGFNTGTTLRQHMLLHDEEKKFTCKDCDKKFSQKSGLTAHIQRYH